VTSFVITPNDGTGPNLPHDTSAATDTTLRASMAREAAAHEASTSILAGFLSRPKLTDLIHVRHVFVG
jgi:hypothetical protein